jgi:orotate phosphoribosyltransferase
VNCRPLFVDKEAVQFILHEMEQLIPFTEPFVVAGDGFAGHSLVTMFMTHMPDKVSGSIINRYDTKDHGENKNFFGNVIYPGKKVVLLEDVVTTGGSLVKLAKKIVQVIPDLEIDYAVSLIDREEGGNPALNELGIELRSVFLLSEVLND